MRKSIEKAQTNSKLHTGKFLFSSFSSSPDSEESDIEDDTGFPSDTHSTPSSKDSIKTTAFEAIFPNMQQVYGIQPETPKHGDLQLLRR